MNFSYRDINHNDVKEIININTKFESYLSPLDNSKLVFLIKESSFAKSIKVKQRLIGFLITIPPNSVYNSIYYNWFNKKYSSFIYIDRVCISNEFQRHGLGKYFYDQVKSNFKKITKRMVCEVNIFPRNKKSDLFHMRYGFKEVGKLKSKNSLKIVSLKSYEF